MENITKLPVPQEDTEKESVMSLGDFVDMDRECFDKFLQDKNLGFLKGAENILLVSYNTLSSMKNDLLSKFSYLNETGEEPETKSEIINNVNSVLSIMLRIEEKVFIVREAQEQRGLQTL